MSLLDVHMPECDRRVRHATLVRADARTVAHAIERADLGDSILLRLLIERCCNALLLARSNSGRIDLDALRDLGCLLFRATATREIALGVVGIPSKNGFVLEHISVEQFRRIPLPGVVKVFVHFGVACAGATNAVLAMETRIRASSYAAAARVLVQWDAFQRLAAAARRDTLLTIKGLAESEYSKRSRWD